MKQIPPGAKRVDLSITVPHDDPHQTITGLKSESPSPYKIRSADFGNKVLHLTVENPQQPGFTVSMFFEVARREHVQERLQQASATRDTVKPDKDLARWLKPDRLVPLDDNIKKWAGEVVEAAGARTDLEKARAIYNHVVSNVKYDK